MTPHLAAALILFSAFLHAGWNALLHKRRGGAQEATFGVLVLSLVVSLGVAWLMGPAGLRGLYASPWVLVSGLSEGIYFTCLGVVLGRLPLGLGYLVMRGVSMLMVTGLSVLFLGEQLSPLKCLGISSIAAGVLVRGYAPNGAMGQIDRRGLRAAVLCAMGICGYHLAYGRALAAGADALPLFGTSLAIALVVNVLFVGPVWAAGALRACWREGLWPLGLAAVICLGAFWLFLTCLSHIEAGTAICLRNVSVVFAQALGWAMGERPTKWAAAGVFLFCMGAALLVLTP